MNKPIREPCWICANRWHCPATNKGRGPCKDFKKEEDREQGSEHADKLYMTYSKLANKMAGVQKRDEASVMQLNNLSLMENIILHVIDTGILTGKHYKEIYQDCKKRLETVKDLAYLEQIA